MASALLVIDLQEDCIGGKKRERYNPELIPSINKSIHAADEAGGLIVYIQNQKTLQRGVVLSPFVKELAILSDHLFTKDKASAFSNPVLIEFLKKNAIDHIELAGIDGNSCVSATALDAMNLGFSVAFPLSLVGIANAERFGKTRARLEGAGITIRK